MRKTILTSLSLLMFIFSAPLLAFAQYYGGGLDTYGLWEPQSCAIGSSFQIERDACYDDNIPHIFSSSPDRGTSFKDFNLSHLNFSPSPKIRQAIYDGIFTSNLQASLQAELNGRDLIDVLDELIEPKGLSTDNIADAVTVWSISAHDIINGVDSDPDKGTLHTVKLQTISAMQDSLASDAEKQRFAESLLVYAFFYDQGFLVKSSNPQAYQSAREAAVKHSAQMGIDFSKIELIQSTGFRAKKNDVSRGSDRRLSQISDEDETFLSEFSEEEIKELNDIAQRIEMKPENMIDEWGQLTPEAERKLIALGIEIE